MLLDLEKMGAYLVACEKTDVPDLMVTYRLLCELLGGMHVHLLRQAQFDHFTEEMLDIWRHQAIEHGISQAEDTFWLMDITEEEKDD